MTTKIVEKDFFFEIVLVYLQTETDEPRALIFQFKAGQKLTGFVFSQNNLSFIVAVGKIPTPISNLKVKIIELQCKLNSLPQ